MNNATLVAEKRATRVRNLLFGLEASCCDFGEVVTEHSWLTLRGEVDKVFGCIERFD